eukprot:7175867-Prymnesium_polylepis.2
MGGRAEGAVCRTKKSPEPDSPALRPALRPALGPAPAAVCAEPDGTPAPGSPDSGQPSERTSGVIVRCLLRADNEVESSRSPERPRGAGA